MIKVKEKEESEVNKPVPIDDEDFEQGF